MNVKRGVVRGAACVLGLAALLGAAALADAKVIYRDSFERPKAGRVVVGGVEEKSAHGIGWRSTKLAEPEGGPVPFQGVVVDLEKAGLHPKDGVVATGTLSLWIQRGEEQEGETLFSLVDENYQTMLYVNIAWEGWSGDPVTILSVHPVPAAKYPLWYKLEKIPYTREMAQNEFFPVAAPIGRGQWFNLTFTWGAASESGIYVDGKRLDAKPKKGFALPRLFADASYLVIGASTAGTAKEGEPLPPVLTPIRSMVDAIEIHDRVISDFSSVYEDAELVKVSAVEHDAAKKAGFSGKLIAGDAIDVTVQGSPNAGGTFDVAYFPDFDRKIELDWRGWGVYLEDKTFFEPGEVDLRDVRKYQVYVSKEPIDPAAPGIEPLERLDVQSQSYTATNLDPDTAYYALVLAEMRDGSLRTVLASPAGLPLTETGPGLYTGSWKVGYQDRFPRAVVVGRLTKASFKSALAGDARTAFVVDPSLTVAVGTDPDVLRADEKSTSKVTVTVTDANGNPVAGHKVKFLLATTSQYTGVVGGGAFAEQVGGSIGESAWGETDLFGKMTVTYVAGFAAKTAVIVARDMASDSTGAGYVKTFINATAELELTPVEEVAAAMEGYEISVTSSDEWLTADGRSEARITAKVTKSGEPVEGHTVSFAVASGTGTIRTVKGTTGRDGEARAVYTAGKKIGLVLITATDTTVDITGSVQIELRSDAPAKLSIKIDPEKMPADGRSTADLEVLVTDINDNPNDNALVEYRISAGGGRLKMDQSLTDRNGKTSNVFTAGRTAGRVAIEITVQSTVPTAEELLAARALSLAVKDSRFF